MCCTRLLRTAGPSGDRLDPDCARQGARPRLRAVPARKIAHPVRGIRTRARLEVETRIALVVWLRALTGIAAADLKC